MTAGDANNGDVVICSKGTVIGAIHCGMVGNVEKTRFMLYTGDNFVPVELGDLLLVSVYVDMMREYANPIGKPTATKKSKKKKKGKKNEKR